MQWLMRPLCCCCPGTPVSNLRQHHRKEKDKTSHGLGLRAYSVFHSESSSRWFNMFHRKGRISKVMHMAFTIFQEGNLFCRYFLDTNSEEEGGFLLMGYTDFISLMGNS